MKSFLFIFLIFQFTFSFSQDKKETKLVVGIIIDQMRHEYLHRFYDRFGEHGFKKLMNEGYEFHNTHFNYVPTKTAVGHASVYTGTTPSLHGIIGNDWYDKYNNEMVYCTSDDAYQTIGSDTKSGKMSPKKLFVSTITDELKLNYHDKNQVISVSIKDRGAILPAGQLGDAFWFDKKTGQFITSSYYMKQLPKWVEEFNKKKLPNNYSQMTWNTMYDIDSYVASSKDDDPSERNIGGQLDGFPYDLSTLSGDYEKIIWTPFGNDLISEFVKYSIENAKLGKGEYTDMLAISFSSTDYVGHASGPFSVELEDTYLRLDKNIGEIIDKLDQEIGKDNYFIFLTADHAVATTPQYLIDRGYQSGYYKKEDYKKKLENKLSSKYGNQNWVLSWSNDQVFLNKELIINKGLNFDMFCEQVVDFLLGNTGISEAYTAKQVQLFHDNAYDIKSKLNKSYHPKISGDVLYVLNPTWLTYYSGGVATGHGSGFTYDTHVPMLWYGNGVKKGSSLKLHSITQIAPTVSFMLDITLPNAAFDPPLYELFDN